MIFLALIGVLLVAVLGSVIRGFVLSILWGWFVVPFGLPNIGIAWAIGISILVGMLTYQNVETKSSDDAISQFVGTTIAAPFLVLLLGWIVHSFM